MNKYNGIVVAIESHSMVYNPLQIQVSWHRNVSSHGLKILAAFHAYSFYADTLANVRVACILKNSHAKLRPVILVGLEGLEPTTFRL